MNGRLLLILRRSLTGLTLLGVAAAAACGHAVGGSDQPAGSGLVSVVAAENFYADIATQVGGDRVHVTSIMSDPNADPHEYESSADNAKAIANASLVIVNGAGYDSFVDKLLAASPRPGRALINVADLAGIKEGDNPHLWYNVDWMSQTADAIASTLAKADPADEATFAERAQRFKASLRPLKDRITAIRAKYGGAHLTQTEPVFGYMGSALGLDLDDGEFQHAIEEGTDPSPQAVAAIDQEITSRSVRALLYNNQTTSQTTTAVRALATKTGVPVIGVSELEPAGRTYQLWMLSELEMLNQALGG